MKKIVVLSHKLTLDETFGHYREDQLAFLKDQYEIIITEDPEILNHLTDVEILLTPRLSEAQLKQANALKWIQSHSSGVNQFPLKTIAERGILLSSAKGIHAQHMSEYALMAMLYFARSMPQLITNQKAHRWHLERQEELSKMTLGILGLGEIGKTLASFAKCFNMRVIANSRSMNATDHVDQMVSVEQLFKESDYLVSILPATKATEKMIDYQLMSSMKKNAVLINIGRGNTLVEKDLIKILDENHLKGVCLDVFEVEPLPSDSPLWTYPQVLITPHLSGASVIYQQKLIDQFVINLKHYMNKEVLLGQIDFEQGY